MALALERIRAALITVAQLETKTTYGALMEATGDPYQPQGVGPVLDVLSADCFARDEPSLGSLAVGKNGEVGGGYRAGATTPEDERAECYRRWGRGKSEQGLRSRG